jgi:hypothetical protein
LTLAHLLTGSGGTDLETVLIAGGITCLGLAFLVKKSVDRKISLTLLALGAVGLVASFAVPSSKPTPKGPTITVQGQKYAISDLEKAIGSLCHATSVVATDVETARNDFIDAHTPLHVIAAALEEDNNRKEEARLLEVTVKVETDLQEDSLGPDFPQHIEEVTAAARRGLHAVADERAVSIEVVAC